MSPAELLKLVEACRATLDQATHQLEELEAATRRLVTGQPKNGHPNAIAASTSRLKRPTPVLSERQASTARALAARFDAIAIKHHGPDAPAVLAELERRGRNAMHNLARANEAGDDDDDAFIPF